MLFSSPSVIQVKVVPATIVFTDDSNVSSGTSSYTFTSQSFGAADASRIIVVGVGSEYIPSPAFGGTASVTIGGVTATEIASTQQVDSASGSQGSMWYAAVPTGTTGSVAITLDGATLGYFYVAVWALYRPLIPI